MVFSKRLDDFCKDCILRDYTRHTVESYRSCIKHFLEHTNSPDVVDMVILTNYLADLREAHLSRSTLNGYFSALSTYTDYLVWIHVQDTNPVPAFRQRYLRQKKIYNDPGSTRQLISIEQMKELLQLPWKTGHVPVKDYLWTIPARDHAIMIILAKTGLRKNELYTLQLSDLDLDKNIIYVHRFAKRSNCIAYIDDEGVKALTGYLDWRESHVFDDRQNLWISHTGHDMRKDNIHDLVVFYASIIGLHNPHGQLSEKFTPHCFRHWFTTWLRRRGMSREHRRWLRGDSPEGADDWYDHIDPQDAWDDYCKYIPKLY